MFDDFQIDPGLVQSQKRLRTSLAAAFGLYAGIGAAVVMASATVRKIVEDEMTQVEFAAEPPPEPEPEPVKPEPTPAATSPNPRPKMRRADLKPPDKISDEKLKESNAALAEGGPSGPVDGFLTGSVGGTGRGTAPAAPKEPFTPPVDMTNHERPPYPKAAQRKGIEGTVVVAFDVLENGSVANPKIMGGPAEFHETVLKMTTKWRFKPAKRGNTPVRFRMTKRVTFRLEDA